MSKAKDSFWHNHNEEPNCEDCTLIVCEFEDGKKEVLWAKSYVDLTRVVRWAYYEEWERYSNMTLKAIPPFGRLYFKAILWLVKIILIQKLSKYEKS